MEESGGRENGERMGRGRRGQGAAVHGNKMQNE